MIEITKFLDKLSVGDMHSAKWETVLKLVILTSAMILGMISIFK
jgi:hypothetical protein